MSPTEPVSNIADASRPNAGRIYDYLLGGNHNFEVDRQAAQSLLKMAPEMPNWTRVIRWFLGEAVRRLLEEGFTHFLDFASGLPTVDHIHQIAPKGTKIIYSDIDPVAVAYAQDMIKGLSDVGIVQCNAAEPERLLQSPILKQIFGNHRKVAIGMNGIAWFLADEQIGHALKVLYDWADKGSKLYICDVNTKSMTKAMMEAFEFYKKVGEPIHLRSTDTLKGLLGEWRTTERGFQTLTDWIGLDSKAIDAGIQRLAGANLWGAILVK
jgi:hypothetical protein